MSEMWRATRTINGQPFVCGFIVTDGQVTEAAPYLRRQILGKPLDLALGMLRGWLCEVVPSYTRVCRVSDIRAGFS